MNLGLAGPWARNPGAAYIGFVGRRRGRSRKAPRAWSGGDLICVAIRSLTERSHPAPTTRQVGLGSLLLISEKIDLKRPVRTVKPVF